MSLEQDIEFFLKQRGLSFIQFKFKSDVIKSIFLDVAIIKIKNKIAPGHTSERQLKAIAEIIKNNFP